MFSFVLVAVLLVLYVWKKRDSGSSLEPPLHPGALPLIGHAHLLVGDSKLVTDPDDCLTVANACLEKDLVYRSAKACFGDGLVTASTETWKEHRKLLMPAFSINYLLSFLGVFNKQSKILLEDLDSQVDKGLFDHGPCIRHNGMETICLTSLGVDFSMDRETLYEYAEAFDVIFNSLTEQVLRFWLHIKFIWRRSSLKKKRDANRDIMYRITDTIIQKRKDGHRNNEISGNYDEGENFKPFLDVFFEVKKSVGDDVMSDKMIRDHVDTLILAGHDTIAAALQFTLILVGSHPEVQDRLHAELQEVFGDTDRNVEKDDLPKLTYVEAVLKETMRLYSVVPLIARYINEDVKLKNYTLQAGHACILLLHGVHRHPTWGKDADQFKPERWLDPSTLPSNPNAFLSFSLGRRVCIGRTYAMISMKTTLAHILRRYRITADRTKLEFKLECLLKPINGHHISIARRR